MKERERGREKGERERDAGLSKAQGSGQGPLCPGPRAARLVISLLNF